MKKLFFCLIPALFFICANTPVFPREAVYITNTNIIDASRQKPETGMTLMIEKGRIIKIAPADQFFIPEHAAVIDGTGRFLIPGLWDCHVHLSYGGESSLGGFVAHGITSVRDMGSDLSEVLKWRAKIQAGEITGPRIYTSGPAVESAYFLTIIEHVDTMLGIPLSNMMLPTRIGMADESEALEAVEKLKRQGADFIKLRSIPSQAAYEKLLTAASEAGLTVAGHEPNVVTLERASTLGQTTLEHLPFLSIVSLDSLKRKELFQHFAKNHTWVTPTLIAFHQYRLMPDSITLQAVDNWKNRPEKQRGAITEKLIDFWDMQIQIKVLESPMDWQALYEQGLADLRLMRQCGVPVLAGSDFSIPLLEPGKSLHEELILLVEQGGMSPREAIRSATLNPAELTGMSDLLGTIEPGKIADLVLLESNPLESIHHIQSVVRVIQNGEIVHFSNFEF